MQSIDQVVPSCWVSLYKTKMKNDTLIFSKLHFLTLNTYIPASLPQVEVPLKFM